MNLSNLKEFKFTSWCVENRTAIYVFTLIVSFAGFVTYQSLPKELFPDVVVPTISVATIYPGATPEDIENLIAKPLEKQIKSINGVAKITSNSMSDFCLVIAEFSTDQDPKVCKQKVTDAVDQAKKDLPTDLKSDPQIQEFDISEMPIMNINLAGDIPLDQLKNYAEDLKDKIETLKEITRVDIIGGYNREIQVNVDLYKMTASGIAFSDIENAIARQNLNISGGEIRIGDLRRNLRVTGEFKDPRELEDLIVRSFVGNPVFLKDIAVIQDGYADKQDFARLDNKTVVTLNVIKRSGENLLNATDKIYGFIDEYKLDKFPEGVKVQVTGDTSEQTRVQLHDLINTVIIGFSLVVLLLMFFMGFQNAFFVGLSVPLSTLIAFLLMPSLGLTMNVMVLFALLLALGIIVDDAIVVIENTHRLYNEQKQWSIIEAAKYAAGEVFVPVLAGTLTTLAPFFPLLLWPGVVGKFMKNLPLTLIITLGASLFVAFVINPVFAVSFMKRDHKESFLKIQDFKYWLLVLAIIAIAGYATFNLLPANLAVFSILLLLLYVFVLQYAIAKFQEKIWPVFQSSYRNLVKFLISGNLPYLVPFITLGIFLLSIFVLIISKPKVEFFPDGEPNFVYIYNKMPMGTDANVTDSITQIIEKRVAKVLGPNHPDVNSVITNVGIGAGDPQNPDKVATPFKSKVTIAFKEYADRKDPMTSKILTSLQNEFKDGVAGAEISVEKDKKGPPVGKPINIEISGDDFAVLTKVTAELKSAIESSGIKGVNELKSDLQLSKPEIIIDINKEKMQREGLSLAQVAVEIRTALFGKEVSKYRDANDDAPIQLRLKEEYRGKVEELMQLNISFMDFATGSFRQVPISSLATLRYDNSLNQINRKNQRRVVTLSSDLSDGFAANEVIPDIQKIIDDIELPEGYEMAMTGEQEQQAETGNFLVKAFGFAFALMLMIMVTQFNSLAKPLIIASSVLFSLIGVFFGNALFGMKVSVVMTGVGFFALAGIVIRNGILIIEFIDELRARGYAVEDAIVEAGYLRVTPVILTAVCTILGLIPLAIGLNIDFLSLFTEFDPKFYLGGDNVAFWGPLAWTMVYGLLVSTFLTLLVVPSIYMLGYKVKAKFRKISQ